MLTTLSSIAGALIAGCVTIHLINEKHKRTEALLVKAQEKVDNEVFRSAKAAKIVSNAAPADVAPGGVLQDFELRCEIDLESAIVRRNRIFTMRETLRENKKIFIFIAAVLGAATTYAINVLGSFVKGHLERGGESPSCISS